MKDMMKPVFITSSQDDSQSKNIMMSNDKDNEFQDWSVSEVLRIATSIPFFFPSIQK